MGLLLQLGQKKRPRIDPVVWMDSTGGGSIQVGCNSGHITVLQLPARCHECPVLASRREGRTARRVLAAMLAFVIAAVAYSAGANGAGNGSNPMDDVPQMTAMSSMFVVAAKGGQKP